MVAKAAATGPCLGGFSRDAGVATATGAFLMATISVLLAIAANWAIDFLTETLSFWVPSEI